LGEEIEQDIMCIDFGSDMTSIAKDYSLIENIKDLRDELGQRVVSMVRLRMTNLTSENTSSKINWQGKIVSIQPRTRAWRYLTDNRTHYHLGYIFFIEGHSSEGKKQFTVAISEKQQIKGLFRIGDVLQGTAWIKKYEEREYADYYKAGSLKLLDKTSENPEGIPPPWIMTPPSSKHMRKEEPGY